MLIVNLGEILVNTIFLFTVFNGIIILIVINDGENMLKRIFYVITLFVLSIDIPLPPTLHEKHSKYELLQKWHRIPIFP